MAGFYDESPFGNYGVSYGEAVLDLAGGYAQRDISTLAKDCAPTGSGKTGATTYVDGERSIALDRDPEETKAFTTALETYLKNPTATNRAAIYNNPKYAYHLRQRTKFTPWTHEVAVMFNDEAEFFARCAQRTGDVKTAANTLVHNRCKAFMAALTADTVTRQKTNAYGITDDNDQADPLPDICKSEFAAEFLTIDHLLELEGKVGEIEDWVGAKLMVMNPKMKTLFLKNEFETLANSLFLPGNNVLRAADCGIQLAGFNAVTSKYCPVNEIHIFEPGATVGKVHWFDEVRGGASRDTKWQKELLYRSVVDFKRLDDYRYHKVKFTGTDITAEAAKYKPGLATGAVRYAS